MTQPSPNDSDVRELLQRFEPPPTSVDIDQILVAGRRRRRVKHAAELTAAVVVAGGLVATAAAVYAVRDHSQLAATGSHSAPPTSPSTSTVDVCAAQNLHVRLGRAGAAMGTSYRAVEVTNDGGNPCTLSGFAKVTFTGGDLGASTFVAGRDRGRHQTLTLQTGKTAVFQVAVANPANFPGGCAARNPSQMTVVVPRDASTTTTFRWNEQICTNSQLAVYVTRYTRAGQ